MISDTTELIFDTTELISDTTELIFDTTELIYFDTTELIFDTTEMISDATEMISDTTNIECSKATAETKECEKQMWFLSNVRLQEVMQTVSENSMENIVNLCLQCISL